MIAASGDENLLKVTLRHPWLSRVRLLERKRRSRTRKQDMRHWLSSFIVIFLMGNIELCMEFYYGQT